MEIIGDKERLVGCNVVVKSLTSGKEWYKDHIGGSFEVSGYKGECESFYVEVGDETDLRSGISPENANILLDSKFLEILKTRKVVVNCETEEEADCFLDWCESMGSDWRESSSNCFRPYGETTCYSIKDKTFCKKSSFIKEDYTIIKFKDCVFPEKTIERKNTMKVIKPFTFKDILDENPCNSNGEVYKLMEEMKRRDWPYDKPWESWGQCEIFDTIVEYKGWFAQKGFIEEVKVFEPFTLEFKIETEDQLLDLWHRLNTAQSTIYHKSYAPKVKPPSTNEDSKGAFHVVNDLVIKLNL